MSFIQRVVEELDFQGKTKSQLAESLGINNAVISMWIKRDSIPSADTALKVADFLGVPLSYLITGEKEPESGSTGENSALFERIESEIEKRGMNRSELSRISGIGESTIRNWKKTEPKARMLHDVAKALNLSMEYLLTGKEAGDGKKSGRNLSPGDRADIERFADVYPELSRAEKRMIMASLEAAAKSTAAASSGLRATS